MCIRDRCNPAKLFGRRESGAALPEGLPNSVSDRHDDAFNTLSQASPAIITQPRQHFERGSFLCDPSRPFKQGLVDGWRIRDGPDIPSYDPLPGLGTITHSAPSHAMKEKTQNIVLRGSLTKAMRAGIFMKAPTKWPFTEDEKSSTYAAAPSRLISKHITMKQDVPAVYERQVSNPYPLQARNLILRLQQLPRSIRVHIYVVLTGLDFIPTRTTARGATPSAKKSSGSKMPPRPTGFLKMTRAQKQAYLSSASMNRIITQVQPQAASADAKYELINGSSCSLSLIHI